jgi:hypothetical protein
MVLPQSNANTSLMERLHERTHSHMHSHHGRNELPYQI